MDYLFMVVLAVDTSNEQGSVALAREGNALEVAALPSGWRSTTLHAEIARLLTRHGLTTSEIQGYGVTTGPGSFTGVRVGLTAVKGLAEIHAKPIVAVSTLQTLGAAARSAFGLPKQTALATVLDARRGQIFGGLYREEDSWLRPLIEDCVCSIRSFLERVGEEGNSPSTSSGLLMFERSRVESRGEQGIGNRQDVVFCGTDLTPWIPEIEKAGWGGAPRFQVSPWLAGPLALIATQRLEKGLGVAASDADANYVRPSDAELFWKE